MSSPSPDAELPGVVAAFTARLDHLVAAWEVAIAASRQAPRAGADAGHRTAGQVRAQLVASLDEIEQQCAEHRREAEAEAAAAADWEERAELAVRRDRDDLARIALQRHGVHATAAEHAAAAAAALDGVRDTYRRALAVMPEAGSPAAPEAPPPGR